MLLRSRGFSICNVPDSRERDSRIRDRGDAATLIIRCKSSFKPAEGVRNYEGKVHKKVAASEKAGGDLNRRVRTRMHGGWGGGRP